jgi:uncharacterized protein (TIGR02147 family)
MTDIFKYSDYRKFLYDWYEEKKERNPSVSYRWVANKVGYRSPGYLSMLFGEKIGMSLSMGIKFAAYMKLKKRETEYFQYMILFGEAKTREEKQKYFDKLRSFREAAVYKIDATQYRYYEKWYHLAIRALLEFFPFKTEYNKIARLLIPSVTEQEAEESIYLLKKLDLIRTDENGFLRPVDALVSTGYDAQGFLLSNFIIHSLRLSQQTIDMFPRHERNFSCLTLGISRKGFEKIQQELREFRRKIMQIAATDNAERIYQLGFQFHPLSRKYKGKGKSKHEKR